MSEQLSPAGATLLRQAREKILADPEHFDMQYYVGYEEHCGTTYCIAGHMAVLAGLRMHDNDFAWKEELNRICGFPPVNFWNATFADLFGTVRVWYSNPKDPQEAVEKINAVLLHYGYPPDEIVEPVDAECEVVYVSR